jgi:hypothetical protein
MRIQPFLVLTLCLAVCDCAPDGQSALLKARNDLDARRYDKALSELLEASERRPELLNNPDYVDLATSAFLGAAGFDLVELLSNWYETYQQAPEIQQTLSDPKSTLPSLSKIRVLVALALPPFQMPEQQSVFLDSAVALSLKFREQISSCHKQDCRRILIKGALANFWIFLYEISSQWIPAAQKLSEQSDPIAACPSLDKLKKSTLELAKRGSEISLTLVALGADADDPKLALVKKASDIMKRFDWIEEFPICQKLSRDKLLELASLLQGGQP